jgi:hypothetical protein
MYIRLRNLVYQLFYMYVYIGFKTFFYVVFKKKL